MSKQIVIIHGGMYFETYEEYLEYLRSYRLDKETLKWCGWEKKIQSELGSEYEVILPTMPSKYNAKYREWKIWFEKLFPLIHDGVILIGKSLGGIFLAKYLAENDFPKKIKAVFLIAPPFEATPFESLGDFQLPESLVRLEKQAVKIFLIYSEDDPVIPFSHLGKYKAKLKRARKIVFKDRGHFKLEQFPEIIELIKGIR